MLVANVTSLGAHADLVLLEDWDALRLQEVRVSSTHPILSEARRRGWQWLPGDPGPDGKPLVGTLVKGGQVVTVPHHGGARAQTLRWSAGTGAVWTITNVYGAVVASQEDVLRTSRAVRDGALAAAARTTCRSAATATARTR